MTRRIRTALAAAAAVLVVAATAAWIAGIRGDEPDAAGTSAPATTNDAAAAAPPGTARGDVVIDVRRQQLIGVRTAAVRRVTLQPVVRTTGTVAFDETRQADVNVKLDGWIRDLYVDYTGQTIRRGDPLFTLYSPELLATQNELLLAHRGQQQAQRSPSADVHAYSERLVEAARQRLLLWDIGAREIEQLESTGRATGVFTVRSPASGFVAEKTAVRGMRVMAGQSLYRIADTSVVWVEANVYEQELSLVRVGQSARVTLDAYPDVPLLGRAIFIHPTVDEQTRAGRVRFQFANRNDRLKPGMFVDVALNVPAAHVLAVPINAVLDSGTEQVVFVAEGEGRFTPRRVRTGRRAGEEVEVVEGLKDGEQVATSAAFFLDSESQLRAGLQNYEATAPPAGAGGPAGATALDITYRSSPDPPRTGETAFEVTVRDAAGQPVTDAEVSGVLFMPAMPTMNMPAMRSETKLSHVGAGIYRGAAQVLMAGGWELTVVVRRGGQTIGTRRFNLMAR